MNLLPTVTLPDAATRQWRQLTRYRQKLVQHRTSVRNQIRSLMHHEALTLQRGRVAWSIKHLEQLSKEARCLEACEVEELWRGQLGLLLAQHEQLNNTLLSVEKKLNAIGQSNESVKLLRSIPGVGPRLSETIVTCLGDVKRFKNAKQVGAYAGLTPRLYESGTMSRQGRIDKRGDRLLRHLLVEVSWTVIRNNAYFESYFDRVCGGSTSRRKIAIVAVARKLLVTCWAMLRDGRPWRGGAGDDVAVVVNETKNAFAAE